MRSVVLLVFMLATASCVAQEAESDDKDAVATIDAKDGSETTQDVGDEAGSEEQADRNDEDPFESITELSGALKITFILLMFTNAVICGRWAIETDRNFWGWYLFGLFTGPLAGGFMLQRTAVDRLAETGGKAPNGCLAVLLGLGIPLAGWIAWLMILA